MPDCRLLIDAPGSGAWNMAIDEVLLESAAQDGVMSLRFYRWSQPTLSLGYFQRYVDRATHPASERCPAVRRPSGGGAIVHDRELTYSLAVPQGFPTASGASALYDAAHDSLLEALAAWGIRSSKYGKEAACGNPPPPSRPSIEPFLCFERRACGDVVLGGHKVCGSAQRRHRGAVLQHGSVLLGTSSAAPSLPGLLEITGMTLHENELIAAWRPRFAQRLCVRAVPEELTPAELATSRQFTLSKHGSNAWLMRR